MKGVKDHLNGPALVEWLVETVPETVQQHCAMKELSFARAIYRWRSGGQAPLATADKWLTMLGVPLSWVPEEFYEEIRPRPRAGHKNYSPEIKKLAARRYHAEGNAPKIAKELGCSDRAVRVWAKKMVA